ncbi:MAG: DUF2298 domain-containing protein [Halobacteriaceae archaeon]
MDVVPVVTWATVLAIIWIAALPIADLTFRDRPWAATALALPLGLAVVGLAGYWIGHAQWGFVGPVAAVLTLVAVAVLAVWRGGEFGVPWGGILAFGIAAGAIVLIRGVDPAIHPAAGEKFLDFGLLQALLRADTLPPEDIWFAGRPVRYYYGGTIIAAVLTRLSGVAPAIAFNLAQATVFGALAAGAYGVGAAVAGGPGRTDPRIAGGLATFFVVAAGNLATLLRLLAARTLPRDTVLEWGHVLYDGIRAPYADVVAEYARTYSYWNARYVIPGTPDVFPAWTFLNGDLRPHMLSAPFLVLVAGLCFALRRRTDRSHRRHLVIAIAAVAGYLTVVNTWALPTTVGLVWLAAATGETPPTSLYPAWLRTRLGPDRGIRGELRRIVFATPVALLVAGIAAALAAPYLLFHTPVNRGIGFLPPGSDLGGLLLVHGVFLAAFTLWLGPRLWSVATDDRHILAAVVAVTTLVFAALIYLVGYPSIAVFGPLILATLATVRYGDGGYALVLVAAGATLVIAMELVYAKVWPFDPNAPRWNTVYKVYHQIWILWGIAAGVLLAAVIDHVRTGFAVATGWRRALRPATLGLLVVLVLAAAMTFPAAALGEHFAAELAHPDRVELSLDGLAYVETYHPDIAPAIEWLSHRTGTPTIVTKPGTTLYDWTNAPSSLTGIPTVLGWAHEKGYRGTDAWNQRQRDVRLLYAGDTELTTAMLDRYDVRYIYVGPRERAAYPVWNYSRIDGVTVAFHTEAVTIYQVNRSVVAD